MDRNGICINEELPNIKNQNFSKEVQEQNCREMIRRDRNHPRSSSGRWAAGNRPRLRLALRRRRGPHAHHHRAPALQRLLQPRSSASTPTRMPVESYLRCTIRGWYDKDDMNLEPSDGQWAGTEYWQHKLSRNPKKPISEHNGTVWLYADHGADREYASVHRSNTSTPKAGSIAGAPPNTSTTSGRPTSRASRWSTSSPHFWRSQYVGQKSSSPWIPTARRSSSTSTAKIGERGARHHQRLLVRFPDVAVKQGVIEGRRHAPQRLGRERPRRDVGRTRALTIKLSADKMMSTADNIVEFKVNIVDKEGVHVYGANNTLKIPASKALRRSSVPMSTSRPRQHESTRDDVHRRRSSTHPAPSAKRAR